MAKFLRGCFCSCLFSLISSFGFYGQSIQAVSDTIFTIDNLPIEGNLLSNDIIPQGQIVSLEILGTIPFGTITTNNSGDYLFAPGPYASAVSTTISYQVCSASGDCSTAQILVIVQFYNDTPLAADDFYSATVGFPLTGNVSHNDVDPDYLTDPFSNINTYSVVSPPILGSVSMNLDGVFTYTPPPNYSGLISFTYANCDHCNFCDVATVYIEVSEGNAPPVVVNGEFNGLEDQVLNSNLLALASDPEGGSISFFVASPPNVGSLNLNVNGTFSYSPPANFFGMVSFNFQACDNGGICDEGIVTLNIVNTNDAPITQNDFITTPEDQSISGFNVATNDSDDSGSLIYTISSQPTTGIAEITQAGIFSYTPSLNYNGFVVVNVQVCDNENTCSSQTINITVSPVNDPPVALPFIASTSEDQSITGIINSASDVDSPNLVYSLLSAGTGGNLSITSSGNFTFVPAINFNGTYTAQYRVCDNNSLCSSSSFSIIVVPINDIPIINSESFNTNEDTPVSGNLSTNDVDVDGNSLTYTANYNNLNGVFTLQTNGSFSFSPALNYNGTISIPYTGCDVANACAQATLTLTVNAVNDRPNANNISLTTNEDAPVTVSLAQNSSDAEILPLSFNVFNAMNGAVTVSTSGNAVFTPTANYSGSASYSYVACDVQGLCDTAQVNIAVIALNDAPVAVADVFNVSEDQSFSGNLALNDSDPENSVLSFSLANNVGTGSLIINTNGTFNYSPAANFSGNVNATYQVCDTQNACTTGNITFVITPVNDSPVAMNGTVSINEDQPITLNLNSLVSDVDNNAFTYTVLSPSNGSLSVNSGIVQYQPAANYFGTDAFQFIVCDAVGACDTANYIISITAVNDGPSPANDVYSLVEDLIFTGNVALNDLNPDNATINFSIVSQPLSGSLVMEPNGLFNYIPGNNFNGLVTFVYQACALGFCSNASVSLNINPTPDFPIALNDNVSTLFNIAVSGNISLNDQDPDGDALSYNVLTPSSNGVFTITTNGLYTYTPNSGYLGSDVVIYRACDNSGLCDTAVVNIIVTNTSTPPVAVTSSTSGIEDSQLSIALNALYTDQEGGAMIYSLIQSPLNGSISVNNSGVALYTPQLNFNGTDNFVWRVCDSGGLCDTAQVNITISALNDAPSNQFLNLAILEDQVGQISFANSDAEGDALTYAVLTGSSMGSAIVSAQTLTFTPVSNVSGITSVILNVCDIYSACVLDTVFISIASVNDAPVANSDVFSTNEDVVLFGNVSLNDSDVEPGALLYEMISAPASGVINFNNNGTFSYTPPLNFSGVRTFSYNCCDAQGICTSANVVITINSVNDAPFINGGFISLNEGASTIFPAVYSDVDNTNAQLSLSLLQSVPGISFTFVANNIIVIPQGNFFGTATANIQVCDGSLCSSAVFTIVVNAIPDPPSASNSVITIFEDQTESAQIPSPNDPDSEDFVYYGISASGEIVVTSNGILTYTCPLNYNGEDTVTYAVCDETGLCDTAQVYVVVLPVNDVPIVDDVYASTDEDVSLSLLFDVVDIENNAVSWSIIQNPANGTLILNSNEATYMPNGNYNGSDSALIRVCDAPGSCSSFHFWITVNSVNDAPQVFGESFTVYAGNPTYLPLSGNDLDVDDTSLLYYLVEGGDALNASIDSNNDLTFIPTIDNLGLYIIAYQACDNSGYCDTANVVLTIMDPSPFPIAVNDTIVIVEDNSINSIISINDHPNDLFSQYFIADQGNNGFAFITSAGAISYTPDVNFNGIDTLIIEMCNTFHCDSSLLIVIVDPINDAPFSMPVNITLTENTWVSGDASDFATDGDNDELIFNQQNEIALGDFNLSANGQYTFFGIQPGVDTVFFNVCDQQYCINSYFVVVVNSIINNPPIAQNASYTGYSNNNISIPLANLFVDENYESLSFSFILSSNPHGEIFIVGDTLIYSPELNFIGTDDVSIIGCDEDLLCDTALVSLTFLYQIEFSIDSLLVFSVDEETNFSGDLNALVVNDDGLNLNYNVTQFPAFGDLILQADGMLDYMPMLNYNGIDSAEITICDNISGVCKTVNIHFIVVPVNDTPQLVNDTLNLIEDSSAEAFTFELFTDADNDLITTEVAISVSNGVLYVEQDLLTYIPFEDYWGMDSAFIQVCDNDTCISAWLYFEVDFVNDAPIVEDDFYQLLMNGQLTGNLGNNDFEPDGEILFYSPLEIDSIGGVFVMNDNGDFSFTADSGFVGVFVVHYFACDPCNICDYGILNIVVASEKDFNTAPVISPGIYNTCTNLVTSINLVDIVVDNEQSFDGFSINLNAPNFGLAYYDFESQSVFYQSSQIGIAEIVLEVCDNALVSLCSSDTLFVTVSSSIHPEITQLEIQNVNCAGGNDGQISISQMNGGLPFDLLWDDGGISNTIGNLAAGVYCMDVDVLEACVLDTTYCFEIFEPQELSFSIVDTVFSDSTGIGMISIEILGGSLPYNEVVWTGPNGFEGTGTTIDGLTYPGTYVFSVSDANGCVISDSIVINSVGVNEVSDIIRIYPNPATSFIYFEIPAPAEMDIMDAAGKTIKNIRVNSSKYAEDIGNLSSGVYYVRIRSALFQKIVPIIKD